MAWEALRHRTGCHNRISPPVQVLQSRRTSVCEKKGHSCVRKIVAYTKWPKREARQAGRCMEKLVRVFGDGWEAWTLHTAPGEVRTGMKLLQSSEKPDVCERCQKSTEMVRGLVCDAGQFYETVSATQAMTAMSNLVTRVRRKSDFDSATVFLHKKRRVFFGGVPNARYGRMWCFSLEELKKYFGIAMCLSLTGLGDRVVRMNGLPIGGLLSKVAASVVLSQEEREWSENETRRASIGHHKTGRRWSSLGAAKGTLMTCW